MSGVPRRGIRPRAFAAGFVAVLALAGCGGSDPADRGDRAPAGAAAAPVPELTPAAFDAETRKAGTVVINVHVPDEGSLPGTDLSIPFDRVARHRGALPSTDTPLAIYCRTGRMTKVAGRTLRSMGYRRIVDLRGGMVAWEAGGRRLLPPAA